MSQKGWTDHELGLEWIKFYDEETCDVANGHWRAVYLDGHSTHLTLELIQYARAHKIVVICLPPKSTHVFQPLDVGIFGPYKNVLHDESSQYEKETGQDVDKDAVLLIAGRAFH
jgi:hypothetical protein